MRDSTIIYRSFYEAIKELPAANQAEVWNAVFEYSLNFVETELSGLSKTIFTLIKPQLDANVKKFHNGKLPKQKGSKKEANDKQDESKTEAKGKQNRSKPQANDNDNVNDNEKENDNANANASHAPGKFISPTVDEVIEYFTANSYTADAGRKAWNYYNTANWKDSKGNKVKNWKQKMQGVWFKDENKMKDTTSAGQKDESHLAGYNAKLHNNPDFETKYSHTGNAVTYNRK